jgi:hypothetical protein
VKSGDSTSNRDSRRDTDSDILSKRRRNTCRSISGQSWEYSGWGETYTTQWKPCPHASPTVMDHDTEKLNSDDDEPSKVSNGGNLRVQNFLLGLAAMELTINRTFRATSRAPSTEPSITRRICPRCTGTRKWERKIENLARVNVGLLGTSQALPCLCLQNILTPTKARWTRDVSWLG